jgi:hypothetical protein
MLILVDRSKMMCVVVLIWQFVLSKCLVFFSYTSATDAVTVYVFQEPSLLSSLQDNGLTDVVLHALLIKDVSTFTSYDH